MVRTTRDKNLWLPTKNYMKILLELIDRDGWICYLCGEATSIMLDPKHRLRTTIDHFIPKCLGGTRERSNLRIACHYCNAIKGHTLLETLTYG